MTKSIKITHPWSDEALMRQLQQGQKAALQQLYARYFDKLVWFARTFVRDEQLAEDLIQEVFIKIIEDPKRFDATARFSTWIYTLTANKCKNHLRDHSNRNRILSNIPRNEEYHMHSQYDYNKMRGVMHQVFEKLSDKHQALFILRFEHQLPLKEISVHTGMPEGTVKSGIFNILKKISEHLKLLNHENKS